MALRLGDFVLYGELRNPHNYSTHGFLVLQTSAQTGQTVLHFELTGNPEPDLRGRTIRFWPDDGEPREDFDLEKFKVVKLRQIGPTGDMSAEGWVHALPCSPEEYARRASLGEPPPTRSVRRFHLEWFGQNGRVVVEVPGALVEQQTRAPENTDDDGDWSPLANPSPPPGGFTADPGLDILFPEGRREAPARDAPPDFDEDDEIDGLQWELDREADAIEQAIHSTHDAGGESSEDLDPELQWLDAYLKGDGEQPLLTMLENSDSLPTPESLDDHEIESQLKKLLAQLAMIGVALEVCAHFSPRDCYRLLVETILPQYTTHEGLIGTDWVQHFSTWESCPECDAALEEEYRAESDPDAVG